MATLKDIARLAGVSTVTASRALNNTGLVSPTTAQRVKSVAECLNYQPNSAAKGLRTGKTQLITLSVPEKGMHDPLLFEFASGVSASCREQGYSLLIDRSNSIEDFRHIAPRVDGIIITDVQEDDERIKALSSSVPLAVFGPTEADVPSIDLDENAAMKLVFEHLTGLGYESIGYITNEGKQRFLGERVRLYTEEIRHLGHAPAVAYGTNDIAGGYFAFSQLVNRVDAVVCITDMMALGAIRFTQEHPELAMPIVGLNGGYYTDLSIPRLTAVTQPYQEVGERIGQMLLDFIQTGNVTHELVQPELVVKESTWPRRDNLHSPESRSIPNHPRLCVYPHGACRYLHNQ